MEDINLSKDPYLATILKGRKENSQINSNEKLSLNSLVRKLNDTFILPLPQEVDRQESFQIISEEKSSNVRKKDLDRNIGSLNELFGEQDVDMRSSTAQNTNEGKTPGIVNGLTNIFQWMGRKASRKSSKELFSTGSSFTDSGDSVIKEVIHENSKLKGKLSNTQQQLNIRDRQISDMQGKIKKLHESINKRPRMPIVEKIKSKLTITESEICIDNEEKHRPSTLNRASINVEKIYGQLRKGVVNHKGGIGAIKKENEEIVKQLQ